MDRRQSRFPVFRSFGIYGFTTFFLYFTGALFCFRDISDLGNIREIATSMRIGANCDARAMEVACQLGRKILENVNLRIGSAWHLEFAPDTIDIVLSMGGKVE